MLRPLTPQEPTATAAPKLTLRQCVNAGLGLQGMLPAKDENVATFTESTITKQPEFHPVSIRRKGQ